MSDLTDEAIRAYAANIFDLEDARETAQTDLKDAWAHIREAHGKRFADSFKLAVKRARMDADKRNAADEIDAEAERIMSVLRAPRATHAIAISVPEHDADGVVIEPTTTKGGDDESRSAAEPAVIIPGRRRHADSGNGPDVAAAETGELQRQVISETNNEPAEGSAEETSAPNHEVPAQDGSGTQQGKSNAALPASVDASVSDDVSGVERSNVTQVSRLPAAVDRADREPRANASKGVTAGETATPDHSKPNPICRDPGDCGVYASWHLPCEACKRAARLAA